MLQDESVPGQTRRESVGTLEIRPGEKQISVDLINYGFLHGRNAWSVGLAALDRLEGEWQHDPEAGLTIPIDQLRPLITLLCQAQRQLVEQGLLSESILLAAVHR